MIELSEIHTPAGTLAKVNGLKTASVKIFPFASGYKVKTCRYHGGAALLGSIRYVFRDSYNDAADYALSYANRIAKEKRERTA